LSVYKIRKMDLSTVKLAIFDVDGVFTNSELLVTEEGQLLRIMNTRDGYMVRHAIKQGIHIAIITGGTSEGVEKRLKGLGIKDIFSGISDKLTCLKNYLSDLDISPSEVLYMGDDYPDWEVLHIVGYPCCPADADIAVAEICKYISPFKGGHGCVRDILGKILLAKSIPLYAPH
jgi:3-deoxy-D-manno-octulosonate 8-phosphate phosphatase (KDO 8-P phosphatase)